MGPGTDVGVRRWTVDTVGETDPRPAPLPRPPDGTGVPDGPVPGTSVYAETHV